MMFGEYLVNKKIISNAALGEILKIQSEKERKNGEKILIGDIIVEQGLVTKNIIEDEFLKYCDQI